mgnify:CR=1 FL=1
MHTAAKAYAEKGVFILAVGPNKAPLPGYGLNTATNDPNTVSAIWAKNPDAGIAIACEASKLVVLDCDPRNGGDETLAKLRQADHDFAEALDTTVQVETQGGGKHYYFAAEVGTSFAGKLGKGLDIKHHGYVVTPPSKGLTGSYGWVKGKSLFDLAPLQSPHLMMRTTRSETQKKGAAANIDAPDETSTKDLRYALQLIAADDRETWINLGMGLKTAGEAGRELWLEWSKRSSKFNQRDAIKTWDSFRPQGTHWKVVFKHANIVADAFIERLHIRGEPSLASKINLDVCNKGISSVLDQPIKPFTELEANLARLHPRMLVEDYLFADLRNLVAAGGIGKTTMLLHEAVYGALGRSIWNKIVASPFTTVIITKEDSREIIVARLNQIMINMELSPSERDIVFRRVWAIDLVGEPFKLAEFSRHVLRPHFENLDKLIIRCNELKPDRIIFDPLMSFSIGESHVNDAEQAIVEASRYIMRKIPNCAVDVVHHTGKGNARAGTTDQYSGRNGSALPDGARMVAVLNKMSTDSFYEATGIKLNFSKRESGLLLSLPKLSYCAPQSDIYIHRRDFLFEAVKPLDIEMREAIANENKAANKNATLETTRQSLLRALTELSSSDDPRDRYPSSSRLLDANGVTGKTSNRKQVLEDLLTLGAIVELNFSEAQLSEFPSKSVLGGRKTYLAIPDNEL